MHVLPTTRPSDEPDFDRYAKSMSGELVGSVFLLGVASILVFWPTDLLLYPMDSPRLVAYATMRAGLLALIGAGYIAVTRSHVIRNNSTLVLGVVLAGAALWLSLRIGARTDFTDSADRSWIYSVYLMPLITLVLVVPLIQRALYTAAYTMTVLLMLAAPDYAPILEVFWGHTLLFLGFACTTSIGVGHVLFAMIRAAHRQQWELVQREAFLTQVNRRLEDELAQNASRLTTRIREIDTLPKAIEEDRKRLARDIHDELGQLLSALRIRLALADQHVGSPEATRQTFGELDELLELALGAVRGIVQDLRTKPNESLTSPNAFGS